MTSGSVACGYLSSSADVNCSAQSQEELRGAILRTSPNHTCNSYPLCQLPARGGLKRTCPFERRLGRGMVASTSFCVITSMQPRGLVTTVFLSESKVTALPVQRAGCVHLTYDHPPCAGPCGQHASACQAIGLGRSYIHSFWNWFDLALVLLWIFEISVPRL